MAHKGRFHTPKAKKKRKKESHDQIDFYVLQRLHFWWASSAENLFDVFLASPTGFLSFSFYEGAHGEVFFVVGIELGNTSSNNKRVCQYFTWC